MHDPSRETVRFDDLKWIAPVDTVEELPQIEDERSLLCYVQAEDAVYQLTNGIWVKGKEISQ